MAELRWNAVANEWVMIASHRQARPQMPKGWCPFCPGSGKVPPEYDVFRYPNDFPALMNTPPAPDAVDTDELFKVSPSYGICEVLLYSSEHNANIAGLDTNHIHKLAKMWKEVFVDFSADPKIKYVYIFENRGEPVGVTMLHPHGQAYGYSFLPKRAEQKVFAAHKYTDQKGRCLFCDLLKAEIKDDRRIIFRNKHFSVYIPFFSHVVYGIFVVSNRHIPDISGMDGQEINALGETVRSVAGMYDCLFDTQLPYMMCMHNAPTNMDDMKNTFHFHIEFIPPMRSGTVQQFFASSEIGAGAWCNPSSPEEKAKELRIAYKKFAGGKQ